MFNFPLFVFIFFASIAVASALVVVTAQSPIRAVLSLVVTFFSVAAIWMLAQAEFLALVLVLVYVGAVMTLFLFVLMMLNLQTEQIRWYCLRHLPLLVLMVCAFIGLLYVASHQQLLNPALQVNSLSQAQDYSNTKALGLVLYTDYILAFEVAGALLLLSIIAAISLTQAPRRDAKRQEVRDQIAVRRSDRVKLVDMPSEGEEGTEDDSD